MFIIGQTYTSESNVEMSMPVSFLTRISLAFAFLLLLMPFSVVRAQSPEGHTVYIPLVQRAATLISGTWTGAVTQAGNAYRYQVTVSAVDQQLQGTATISDGTFFATMQITGGQFGTHYLIDETSITDTNGVPPGTRWCLKSLLLEYDTTNDSVLSGTWKQDGCNGGRVYLQRPQTPIVAVAGTWAGNLTQSTTSFSYTISLNQDNSNILGVSTISSGTKSGTLRLKGFVIGDYVILQETEVLQSNNQSWCLKTVEMKQTGTKLEGNWSAVGCIPGTVSLQKQ